MIFWIFVDSYFAIKAFQIDFAVSIGKFLNILSWIEDTRITFAFIEHFPFSEEIWL